MHKGVWFFSVNMANAPACCSTDEQDAGFPGRQVAVQHDDSKFSADELQNITYELHQPFVRLMHSRCFHSDAS